MLLGIDNQGVTDEALVIWQLGGETGVMQTDRLHAQLAIVRHPGGEPLVDECDLGVQVGAGHFGHCSA